jgi:hypothetical protein
VTWEGDQAVEECTDDDETTVVERRNAVLKVHRKTPEVKIEVEESDDGLSSEDEYVDDKLEKNKSADRVCYDVFKIYSIGLICLSSVAIVSSLLARTLIQAMRREDAALAAIKFHRPHQPSNMVI